MKQNMVGKEQVEWQKRQSKTITFIVTEDCQLCCRYCYLVGKNNKRRMNIDIAKKAVDYLLKENTVANSSVIFDFIGGEPFLEIDLIDQLCDYIKLKMYEENHPWFDNYRFSFATNGLMYDDVRLQRYIEKNKTHLSIGITIDGTKAKHDLQRIYADGRGSYEGVVKNIPLWLSQFPDASTKVTVGSEDLAYIKESIVHLWDLGIKNVNSNVVFEDVWQQDDDIIFEAQLKELADYMIDKQMYKEYNCSFFSEYIGKPLDPQRDNQNWCGTGKMVAVDCDGSFYPCVRFSQFSLERKKAIGIGNCFDGIDLNRLRPFLALNRTSQSPAECLCCEVASGCAWCQGVNYDYADTDTIYQRAVFLCRMHKARVRANNYYWEKLRQKMNADAGLK